MSAVGRNYFRHHWNHFDVLIIIIGIIDVVIINIIKRINPTYAIIYTIRILRFLRVVRILRLLKVMIPKIIFLLNKQINRQLTFRYDIAKGYVQGEEDVKCLIGQIAGHEKVYFAISKILENNKQEAMKELVAPKRKRKKGMERKFICMTEAVINVLNSLVFLGMLDEYINRNLFQDE